MILHDYVYPKPDHAVCLFRFDTAAVGKYVLVVVLSGFAMRPEREDRLDRCLNGTKWQLTTQKISELKAMSERGLWFVYGLREGGS